MITTHPCSTVRRCLYSLAALVVCARASEGQLAYEGTGFIHGFASSGKIWTTPYPELGGLSTISFVSQFVNLKTVWAPSFDTLWTFGQITSDLNRQLVRRGTPQALVTHSIGGMAARYSYYIGGDGATNTAAIVTVGTPHQGAILADSVEKFGAFLSDMDRRVNDAKPYVAAAAKTLFYAWQQYLGLYILSKVAPASPDPGGATGLLTTPTLPALKTNSQEIQVLNATSADAGIPRANIVGTLSDNKFMPLKIAAAFSGESEQRMIDNFQKSRSWFHACKVAYYGTIVGALAGRKCGWAERMLGRVDETWQRYSSGSTITRDVLGRILIVPRNIPTDGVVPNERSTYPFGAIGRFSQMRPVLGANHLTLYKLRDGAQRIADALIAVGAARNTSYTALGASISGQTSVSSGVENTWSAAASGGVKPYAYAWYVGALHIGTGSTVTYSDTQSFGLQLVVTDAGGQTATTVLQVTVTGLPRY